jgi:hypothetical protein
MVRFRIAGTSQRRYIQPVKRQARSTKEALAIIRRMIDNALKTPVMSGPPECFEAWVHALLAAWETIRNKDKESSILWTSRFRHPSILPKLRATYGPQEAEYAEVLQNTREILSELKQHYSRNSDAKLRRLKGRWACTKNNTFFVFKEHYQVDVGVEGRTYMTTQFQLIGKNTIFVCAARVFLIDGNTLLKNPNDDFGIPARGAGHFIELSAMRDKLILRNPDEVEFEYLRVPRGKKDKRVTVI